HFLLFFLFIFIHLLLHFIFDFILKHSTLWSNLLDQTVNVELMTFALILLVSCTTNTYVGVVSGFQSVEKKRTRNMGYSFSSEMRIAASVTWLYGMPPIPSSVRRSWCSCCFLPAVSH
ncbi:hypothetical protein PENTCL1PPCAC_12416, partial [Pristionchus entomophagus]